MGRWLPGLILCLILAPPLRADEIRLRDGRRFVGKILEVTPTHVRMRTKFGGVMTFPRSEVVSIRRTESKEDEYRRRLKALKPRDAAGHFALARWCRQVGLLKQYRELLAKVIALDPDHAEARKALGYVRYQGRWVTKKEKERLEREAREAEYRRKGYVRYRGKWLPKEDVEKLKRGLVRYGDRWVTPEEKKYLEKGLVYYEGEWITKEEKEKREQGLYRIGRRWVTEAEADKFHSDWNTPWVIRSTGFEITSNAPIAYLRQQKRLLTTLYQHLVDFCGGRKPPQAVKVFIFATVQQYNQANAPVPGLYFANHANSYGGVYNPTVPAVHTYRVDQKFYQYQFLGHAFGEAFLLQTFGAKVDRLWFKLGVGTAIGYFEIEPFAVNYVWEKVRAGFIPLRTLLETDALADTIQSQTGAVWNERFFLEAAALIYFLRHDPRYRDTWQKFLAALWRHGDPTEQFRRHFRDLAQVEKDLKAWLQSGRLLKPRPK